MGIDPYDEPPARRQGSAHHASKLNEKTVRKIRSEYKWRSREFGCHGLARKYGVDPSTIHAVVKGETWKE